MTSSSRSTKAGCGSLSEAKRLQSHVYNSRGSEASSDFEAFQGLTPHLLSPPRPAHAFLVPGTPMHAATRVPSRPVNQSGSHRSHLYSPSVSQLVDSECTREIFHLASSQADGDWRSVDEEDERSSREGRHNLGISYGSASLLPRQQQAFSSTSDTQSTLNQQVVLL